MQASIMRPSPPLMHSLLLLARIASKDSDPCVGHFVLVDARLRGNTVQQCLLLQGSPISRYQSHLLLMAVRQRAVKLRLEKSLLCTALTTLKTHEVSTCESGSREPKHSSHFVPDDWCLLLERSACF